MEVDVAGAMLAGAVGLPHCAGMCGPFATAASSDRGGLLAWHLGRASTYISLGAATGALAGRLPVPPAATTALAAVMVLVMVANIGGWLPPIHWGSSLAARLASPVAAVRGPIGRYLFGVATGLLPCGLVWAALGLAVARHDAAGGAMVMGAFALGTVPGPTAAAWLTRRIGAPAWARPVVAAGVLATSGWSLILRAELPVDPNVSDAGTAATHEERP